MYRMNAVRERPRTTPQQSAVPGDLIAGFPARQFARVNDPRLGFRNGLQLHHAIDRLARFTHSSSSLWRVFSSRVTSAVRSSSLDIEAKYGTTIDFVIAACCAD